MLTPEQLKELTQLLPNKVFTSTDQLKKHRGEQFYLSQYQPDAVCYAESEEDVLKLVDFCLKYRTPLIPFGAGTSLEGHIAAIHGGICLDLSHMRRVIEVNTVDHYAVVEPGLPYNELNAFLESQGFHFPVEAGWGANIGGMVATNASGAGATDAGSMTKNVMGCEVIVYNNDQATKISTGTKTLKSSAGYNLTSLFVGAEGTLGIVTAITLRIRKNFANYATIICQFDDLKSAIQYVLATKGIIHYRKIELLDILQTKACIAHSNIKTLYPDKNTVLIELAGNQNTVQEELQLATEKLNKYGASGIQILPDKKAAASFWMMRKHAATAAMEFFGKDKLAMVTDACIPLSALANCIDACYALMTKLDLYAPLIAHIGDGNFHFTIAIDPQNPKELEKAKTLHNLIVEEALKRGGTCTGEHGIGLGKKFYLIAEHGNSIFVMQQIKKALDPHNIFNPGKIFDV